MSLCSSARVKYNVRVMLLLIAPSIIIAVASASSSSSSSKIKNVAVVSLYVPPPEQSENDKQVQLSACWALTALDSNTAALESATLREQMSLRIDQVLLIDADVTLPVAVASMLSENNNTRVVPVKRDIGWTDSLLGKVTEHRFTVHILKLEMLRLIEYDALLYIDADFFVYRVFGKGAVSPFYAMLEQGATFVGRESAWLEPVNGGYFGVVPDQRLYDARTLALAEGFDYDLGWHGADYKSDEMAQLDELSARYVAGAYMPESRGFQYCVGRRWCFNGASTDQGLLFHLIAERSHNATLKRVGHRDAHMHMTGFNKVLFDAELARTDPSQATFAKYLLRTWPLVRARMQPVTRQHCLAPLSEHIASVAQHCRLAHGRSRRSRQARFS
jgi:hypothetical protein